MKKRIAPDIITNNHSDDINLNTDEKSKKKRSLDYYNIGVNKKQKNEDIDTEELLKSLFPFDFLVTSPPIAYYRIYTRLGEWLEGCINDDFKVEDNPFTLLDSEHKSISTFFPQAIVQLEKLIEDLNKSDLLKENWRKFTIVDKILSLHNDDQWSHSNVQYITLQNEVWWVKTVNQFYSSIDITKGNSIDNHLSHATFTLILELFYRYIWSMYTKEIYKTIELENNVQQGDINSETNKDDEVYDVEALGEMSDLSESESEIESDSSSEAENDEESISSNNPRAEDLPVCMDDENVNEIPNVIPLFYNHAGIKLEIDKIEAKWFDGENWDISPLLTYFANMLTNKYKEIRKDVKFKRKDISNKIISLYNNSFCPFLNQMGITSNDTIWSIEKDDNIKSFFGTVMKLSFINLTNNGNSLSRTFFYLFSNISLFSDSRTLLRMADFSEKAYLKLKERESAVSQIESLYALMEQLNEEKQILMKSGKEEENPLENLECIPEQLKRNMTNRRELRLLQLEEDIESIKEELNKLTGELDKKESRKSKRRLPLTQLLVDSEDQVNNISKLEECSISDKNDHKESTLFSFKNLI